MMDTKIIAKVFLFTWVAAILTVHARPGYDVTTARCEWAGVQYRGGEVFAYTERCVRYGRCVCVGEYRPDEVYCLGGYTHLDLQCLFANNLIVKDWRKRVEKR